MRQPLPTLFLAGIAAAVAYTVGLWSALRHQRLPDTLRTTTTVEKPSYDGNPACSPGYSRVIGDTADNQGDPSAPPAVSYEDHAMPFSIVEAATLAALQELLAESQSVESASATAPTSPPPLTGLALRAHQIEVQANRELEELVPLLGLEEYQQDRVFEILARRSIGFDPSLLIATLEPSGENPAPQFSGQTPNSLENPSPLASPQSENSTRTAPTKEDEIVETALDPDQAGVYTARVAQDYAWWEYVVGELESELDGAIRSSIGTSPPAENSVTFEAPPPSPESEGGLHVRSEDLPPPTP